MALAALGFAVLALLMGGAPAFDNDELEIFDLVEEVNKNFYEYLELDVDGKATTNEIRKAYKKLALVWHPDKSDAEDAEVRTYNTLSFNVNGQPGLDTSTVRYFFQNLD